MRIADEVKSGRSVEKYSKCWTTSCFSFCPYLSRLTVQICYAEDEIPQEFSRIQLVLWEEGNDELTELYPCTSLWG